MISLIKRLFGIRNANKDTTDTKIDFDIPDLKKGYIFDYDMSSWEVEDVVVYTWDNGVKDLEFNIFNGKDKMYLNYEKAGSQVSIFWEAKLNDVWAEARNNIRKKVDISEREFKYKGNTYYFAGEGSAKVSSSTETFHMQNWLFQTDSDDSLVSINKYEDNSMEVYVGKKLKLHEISNILPR